MKTELFQSCGHCWVFQICWHIECSTFTASFFRIWNSSTGIPSPPLALFVVMLSMAHLISHSRMSGSRWVGSSVGKESACNAWDPGLITRLGRSTGERIGYPLQYSWASLVAQLVKNLPAMWETRIRSLGWEDPLEKGKANHSSILARIIPQTV